MAQVEYFPYLMRCTHRGRNYFPDGVRKGYFIKAFGKLSEYAPLKIIHGEIDCSLSGHLFEYALSLARYHATHVQSTKNASIKLAALIDEDHVLPAISMAQNLIAQGYSCLKIKVGKVAVADEAKKIKIIARLLGPKGTIRLDANKRYDYETASKLLSAIKRVDIEYFEEPLLDKSLLKLLRQNYEVPLALDESFDPSGDVLQVPRSGAEVLVIKPSRFSSIYRVLEIIEQARINGIQVVFSHCFESELTSALIAFLIADAGLLDKAHGIFAENFFKDSMFPLPLRPFRGQLILSQCHGFLNAVNNLQQNFL